MREKSEEDSKKVHPFIRAILKKEKSEDIAKEIIGAHMEDQKREIGPDEQNVGKEINRITENMIEVTDYLGTDLPEDLRHVQSFNHNLNIYSFAIDLKPLYNYVKICLLNILVQASQNGRRSQPSPRSRRGKTRETPGESEDGTT